MFVDQLLDSYKEAFDDVTIDELLDKQHNDLSARTENWKHECSGWIFHWILRHQRLLSKKVYIFY